MHNNTAQNRNRRHSRSRNGSRRISTSQPPVENDGSTIPEGELTNSLDQGMAAVRQWIQSREDEHGSIHQVPRSPILCLDTAPSIDMDDNWMDERLTRDSTRSVSSTSKDTSPATPQHERILRESLPQIVSTNDSTASERLRQRSLSEPDEVRIRNWLFQQAVSAPERHRRYLRVENARNANRQQRWWPFPRSNHHGSRSSTTGQIEIPPRGSLSATSSPHHTSQPPNVSFLYASPRVIRDEQLSSRRSPADSTNPNDSLEELENRDGADNAGPLESSEHAMERWTQINSRFQTIITLVALVFSLLLFAILLCWVLLTSAYAVTVEQACDLPLRTYYWLVTFQLVLDVFRSDIMRLFFRWDANSNQGIPCRVITYNFAYLAYALLVLRMGVDCIVFQDKTTCRNSAPELFQASAAFVYLSSAAWATLTFGYLIPFCVVAILLTWNGYTPSADNQSQNQFTFPTAMSAPSGTVDRLRGVDFDGFPRYYPTECCICMEKFTAAEEIVATECNHVFHKQCCRDWLRQARTCPVCRMDIPDALDRAAQARDRSTPRLQHVRIRDASRTHLHHEVVSLLQILRSSERRLRRRRTDASRNPAVRRRNSDSRLPSSRFNTMEEGRAR
ncbi:unnamed protein product [Cylindrotheca closterium]|uniref:RING-type domain-containing protein n=1 Tax=Cylindrotheca closterium TaxID=2856 RepID=A0AAD2G9R1_9STRA|nr:unnamed protein product [Cylindrotheca closterium]